MSNTFFPAVQYAQQYQPENMLSLAQLAQGISGQRQAQAQSAELQPGRVAEQGIQNQLGQQEIQQRQQQLNDQQALTKGMQEWDGKNIEELPGLVLKHGGSATAVLGLKQQVLTQKKALTELDTQTLANQSQKNDMLLGQIQAAGEGDDAGLAARLSTIQPDPQHQQTFQQLLSLPPDQIRAHLPLIEKELMGAKEQFSQENQRRETDAKQLEAQAKATGAATSAAEFKAKLPGGPLNQVTQSVEEARQKAPIELSKALAIEQAKQKLTQGSPDVAGKMLADRTLTIDEMRVRGLTPEFQQQAILAAQKYDPNFKAPEAAAQARIAGNNANQQFFGNTDSLLVKGGTLDQLEERGKALGNSQLPAYNSLANWTKAALGSGPQAAYAASVLGVADDYSKVMTGGQGSDTSRQQALDIISKNLSPEGRAAAVQQIREQVLSQRRGRQGTNPYLKNMFPEPGEQDAAAQSKTPQLSNFHVNPKTGERIGWDGTKWVPAPKQ